MGVLQPHVLPAVGDDAPQLRRAGDIRCKAVVVQPGTAADDRLSRLDRLRLRDGVVGFGLLPRRADRAGAQRHLIGQGGPGPVICAR